MKNMSFFESGQTIIPASAGFVSMSNYERIFAYFSAAGAGAISQAFRQAEEGGANPKAVNVKRVWFVAGANSDSNNWQLAEAAGDGFDTVNAANFPELAAAEAGAHQLLIELQSDVMDASGGFVEVDCASATTLILTGARYPQQVPTNPIA